MDRIKFNSLNIFWQKWSSIVFIHLFYFTIYLVFFFSRYVMLKLSLHIFLYSSLVPFFSLELKNNDHVLLLQIYAIHKKKSYVVCFLTLNLYNCVQFCIFSLLSLSPSSLIFFSFLKSCKHFSLELFVLLLSSY